MTVGSCEFESHLLHNKLKINRCQVCKNKRGNSSVGRAQPCQGWGREFEPRFPLLRTAFAVFFCLYMVVSSVGRVQPCPKKDKEIVLLVNTGVASSFSASL